MRTVLTILLCLIAGSVAGAGNPSPMLKQLHVGAWTYGGSSIWAGNGNSNQVAMRNWYAMRYSESYGTGNATDIAAMKLTNPNHWNGAYQLYMPHAYDSAEIRQIVDSIRNATGDQRYSMDTLFWHVGSQAITTDCGYTKNWQTTSGANAYVTQMFYQNNPGVQNRLWFNVFYPQQMGTVLGVWWAKRCDALGSDWAMVDEGSMNGYTGFYKSEYPGTYLPWRNWGGGATPAITWYAWITGRPDTHLKNWPTGLRDFETKVVDGFTFYGDANTTAGWEDVADSIFALEWGDATQKGWMRVARDVMAAKGKSYAINWSSVGLRLDQGQNWPYTGPMHTAAAGAYVAGEYNYWYPGEPGYESNILAGIYQAYDVRNLGARWYTSWTRVGPYDLQKGLSYSRSKMNALGNWLEMLFPGTTTYYFSPCTHNGQVDFYNSRQLSDWSVAIADSAMLWSYAWTKYFGVPLATRDSTTRGTDPVGQSYTIHKVQLNHPTTGNPLTYAIGRYNRPASTMHNVSSGTNDYTSGTGSAITDNVIRLGKDAGGVAYKTAIRFPIVTVPRTAFISSMRLSLRGAVSETKTGCNVKIYGHNIGNSPALVDGENISSRTKTTAAVTWTLADAMTAGTRYLSPDLKTIGQEILAQSGYTLGNAMTFIIEDNGSATNSLHQFVAADSGTASWAESLQVTWYVVDTSATANEGSGVVVTVPVQVYQLNDNTNNANGRGSDAAYWSGPYGAGYQFTVANAEWLILSADTTLANNGPVDTTLSIGNASNTEGSPVTFTVYLSRVLTSDLSFTVNTSSTGSAASGTDFTPITNQVYTITAGSMSVPVIVSTVADSDIESDETFRITISSPTLGTVNTGTATGTILNDDSPPVQTSTNGGRIKIWKD